MLRNRVPGVHLSIAERPAELKQKEKPAPNCYFSQTKIDAAILELNQKNI